MTTSAEPSRAAEPLSGLPPEPPCPAPSRVRDASAVAIAIDAEPETRPRIRCDRLALDRDGADSSEQRSVAPRAQQSGAAADPVRALLSAPSVTAASRLFWLTAAVVGGLVGSAPYLLCDPVPELRAVSEPVAASRASASVATPRLASDGVQVAIGSDVTASAARAVIASVSQAEPPSMREPVEAVARAQRTRAHTPADLDAARPRRDQALLQLARRQLRSGDSFGAQRTLARVGRHRGQVEARRERRFMEIQVQLSLGARAQARKAARTFAKAYPGSSHLRELQGLLLAP